MKDYKIIVKRIISSVLFTAIIITFLTHYSYLKRERDNESNHITGITQVENLDVVFVGSSVIETSWMPHRAWLDRGITTYDYSCSHQMGGSEYGLLKYLENIHDPKLYVLDVRDYMGSVSYEFPFTKYSQMSYSIDRLKAIHDCYGINSNEEDKSKLLGYYFDLLTYQGNKDALGKEENWKNINNDERSQTLGWLPRSEFQFVNEPDSFSGGDEPITENSEKALRHLLENAKKDNLNILFIAVPYPANDTAMKRANTVEKIIAEYDYPFLNMVGDNAPYEVDYSRDFSDIGHLNVFGAEKLTDYLGEYIVENYDIADHRNDEKYADWDTMSKEALDIEESTKDDVEAVIGRKSETQKLIPNLSSADDFFAWYNLANSLDGVSIFMVAKGEALNCIEGEDGVLLRQLQLDAGDKRHWIKVQDTIYTSGDNKIDNKNITRDVFWSMSHEDDEASIIINDVDYSKHKDGINVVAWNDDFGEVVDSFAVTSDENGRLKIER